MECLEFQSNIQPFDGKKYRIWKLRVRCVLTLMDVIHVIDEEPPKNLTDEWIRAENIAKCKIMENLSDSFLWCARSASTAKEIFKNLDAVYERKSLSREIALLKQLRSLKLQDDASLEHHFTIFDDLIVDLSMEVTTLEERDRVIYLLLTLPNSYDDVIPMIDALPEDNVTLSFVKMKLLEHEVKLREESIIEEQKSSRSSRESWKPRKQSRNKNSQQTAKCYQCGRRGHKKKDCYYYKRSRQYSEEMKRENCSDSSNDEEDYYTWGIAF